MSRCLQDLLNVNGETPEASKEQLMFEGPNNVNVIDSMGF